MASDLENSRKLRFKLPYIDRQFPSRDLTVRESVGDNVEYNIPNRGAILRTQLPPPQLRFSPPLAGHFICQRKRHKKEVEPYCKRMLSPCPFPAITSSNITLESLRDSTRAMTTSLCSSAIARLSKGKEDHAMSSISATANSAIYRVSQTVSTSEEG